MNQPAVKKRDLLESQIEKRNELATQLLPFVGPFDYSSMTAADVAKYACSRLGVKVSPTHEGAAIRGFLAGYERARQDAVKALSALRISAA